MVQIKKMIINYNYSKRTSQIKYIVIHDTGNTGVGAGVKRHFNYFNSGVRNASADYFVDVAMIGQFVEDYNCSWHCGDGRGMFGITNQNSIGIEICINADGDYNQALKNVIELTKHLMTKYNIPIENVVRHWDASRKSCPNSMRANNWEKWHWFKAQLVTAPPSHHETPYIVQINTDTLNVRAGAGINYKVVTTVTRGYKYTITETVGDWGRLKSGVGWINLKYTKRI